eukprot:COSAG01_NODE_49054_length_375_cov_1.380435_1_plen_49_part_00
MHLSGYTHNRLSSVIRRSFRDDSAVIGPSIVYEYEYRYMYVCSLSLRL